MRYVIGVVVSWVLATLVAAQPVSFHGLGIRPGGGSGDDLGFEASGISPDGRVVWGTATSNNPDLIYEAFRWSSDGGVEYLGTSSGTTISGFRGSNADASLFAAGQRRGQGLYWSEGSGWNNQSTPDDWEQTTTYSVSDDGAVMVGHARRRRNGIEERLPAVWRDNESPFVITLPNGWELDGAARAVSGDGNTIVGYGINELGLIEAFRRDDSGTITGLGTIDAPNYVHSYASAASNDGTVVIGAAYNGLSHRAFRWTEDGGMVDLGFLAYQGTSTKAIDVSADGSLVVGWTGGSYGLAFLWDEAHGMRDLRDVIRALAGEDLMAGWSRMGATGISADGQWISGQGTNPNGQREVWVAHIPAPPTLLAIGIGAIALGRRSRG